MLIALSWLLAVNTFTAGSPVSPARIPSSPCHMRLVPWGSANLYREKTNMDDTVESKWW